MEDLARALRALSLLGLAAACGNEPSSPEPPPAWQVVQEDLPGALLSLWGNSDGRELWAVGADARDGTGPVVLRRQGVGTEWERLGTGLDRGSLWWVFGFDGGPVYLGGEGGLILRYADGAFSPMEVPGQDTVYGIWGASPDDVWAVGSASESAGGFAWRLRNGADTWQPESSVPESVGTGAAIWKVFGLSRDDAWLVGSNGVALHWDGQALAAGDTGVGTSLFTVHANSERYVAVGGFGTGFIVESEAQSDVWKRVEPDYQPVGLSGVCLGEGESGLAVGVYGSVYRRSDAGWQLENLGFGLNETLHAAWIDPTGGLWAVGGWTFEDPPTQGLMIHRPPAVNGSQ